MSRLAWAGSFTPLRCLAVPVMRRPVAVAKSAGTFGIDLDHFREICRDRLDYAVILSAFSATGNLAPVSSRSESMVETSPSPGRFSMSHLELPYARGYTAPRQRTRPSGLSLREPCGSVSAGSTPAAMWTHSSPPYVKSGTRYTTDRSMRAKDHLSEGIGSGSLQYVGGSDASGGPVR